MILGLEIFLTILAWRRGWKGWALLPLVIAFGAAFLFGLIMGISGASEEEALVMSLGFDIACIAVLIGMTAKPRNKSLKPGPEPTNETTASTVDAN
ncbi:hypothetical protein ACFLTB_02225 [Chloroflexota bacterium]